MSALPSIIHHIYAWPLSTAVRESEIAFPVIQTFHVIGIALMAGTIAIVDLRLVGVLFRRLPAIDIARPLLPVTWLGFAVMVISGSLLFAAQSEKIYENFYLRIKLLLLIVAGLNVILFHATTYRAIAQWGPEATPASAKFAGLASLLLWSAVIVTGRFIAYY
jgi:hypothetical protein